MDIFYQKTNAPYGCLQNFFVSPFTFDNRMWRTVEHCYQAFKFEDKVLQEYIRNQPNAYAAALIGRNPQYTLRPGWDDKLKINVMCNLILQKFTQCNDLREILLSTGDANLYELSYKDNFWGTKPDKSGLNHQGKITMAVRAKLLNPI